MAGEQNNGQKGDYCLLTYVNRVFDYRLLPVSFDYCNLNTGICHPHPVAS